MCALVAAGISEGEKAWAVFVVPAAGIFIGTCTILIAFTPNIDNESASVHDISECEPAFVHNIVPPSVVPHRPH
jgi:hypothetical protein